MKQLTKEQLTELVHENYEKITELNSEGIGERVSDFVKDLGGNCEEVIVNFVVAYCAEKKKECCNILIETLYDVLYGG